MRTQGRSAWFDEEKEKLTTEDAASLTEDTEKNMENRLSHQIIGAAIEVHRELGPGLLESAYEECLAYEMGIRDLRFERQKAVPVIYKGVQVECGFRADFVVADQIVVELKAIDSLLPIHQAQLLTYLKLTDCPIGLLINFNTTKLLDGLKRLVWSP